MSTGCPLGDMGSTISVTAFTNPEVRFFVNLTGDQFHPPLLRASPAAAAERLAKDRLLGECHAGHPQRNQPTRES